MPYGASSIEILEDLEHVRKRPAMYIGDTGEDGMHHLLKEVVDNAIDEHLDGHVSFINVEIDPEKNIARVWDDGRGIPVSVHPKAKISTLTAVFTKLHAGGKFGKGAYTSAVVGLHGIGIKAVNALSARLVVDTVRPKKEGKIRGRGSAVFRQVFVRGEPVSKVARSDKMGRGEPIIHRDPTTGEQRVRKLKRGTLVQFQPDPEIFGGARFDPTRILPWLNETVFLCPKLTIRFTAGLPYTMCADKGLPDLIDRYTDDGVEHLHDPIHVRNDLFEAALVWTSRERELWRSYVNVSPTPEHGVHVLGIKKSIMRMFNDESKVRFRGEDLRDGLIGVVHAFVHEPKFRGQTKTRLENHGLDDQIADLMDEALKEFILHNKPIVKEILARAGKLRDARKRFDATKKAIKGTKVGKGATNILPGKLIEAPDCSPEDRELYIVEGDGALGIVRDARIRKKIRGRKVHYQEVFPLKGKPLNVVRQKSLERALKNDEIRNLVLAIGAGVGPSFNIDRMRCRAVYLLTDADPDGQHIQALLLGFFTKYMPDLIAEDRVRVVLNPLFMGVSRNTRVYGDTIEDVKAQLDKSSLGKYRIQRFKGLGESNASDLQAYAMDPRSRRVLRVEWDGEDDRQLVLSYLDLDSSARKAILNIIE